MDKQEIINQLLELPRRIHQTELLLNQVYYEVQVKKDYLTAKEDQLVLSGVIDGKNAETRQAQLRSLTVEERQAVQQAENQINKVKAELNRLLNTQANLRAIAKLLVGGE